jgi:hypothetical protein
MAREVLSMGILEKNNQNTCIFEALKMGIKSHNFNNMK